MRSLPPALLALLTLVACGGSQERGPATGAAAGLPWFEEVAQRSGLDFRHVRSHELRYWIPETVTGGAAFLDYDGDGLLDVFCVQGGDPIPGKVQEESDRLFKNLGGGRFADVTEAAGVGGRGYGFGCATGDYDNDGDVDLYVANLERNLLHRNEGDGTFVELGERAGVAETKWSSASMFLDYDQDGFLDLFVVNYLAWSPEREMPCKTSYGERDYCNPINYDAPTQDTLYRNRGDGSFEDVSVAAGISKGTGTGLGCVTADFDGDGRPDIYVTNDGMPNFLWINDGRGGFRETALLAGCAVNGSGSAEAGMGVQAFDLEDDGRPDLYMTHVREQTNTFYSNAGGQFADRTARVGLARPSLPFTGFGLGAHDFDHDGLLDLFVANGRVGLWRPMYNESDPFAEPNQLFRGVELGKLEEIPDGPTAERLLGTSRAAAFADYDEDGDLDILYVDANAPVRLLRNVAPKRGHWLGLRLLLEHGSDALGAKVSVEAKGRARYRLCHTTYSYCAANDPRVHLGLGEATRAERVTVTWPDGRVEQFGSLEADRYHALRRGQGRAASE